MKLSKSGVAIVAASALSSVLLGPGTAGATTQATNRLANYTSQQCMASGTAGNLYATACLPILRLKQWVWSGTTNRDTKITNAGTALCLDSNPAGDVFSLRCNGTDNQLWKAIQYEVNGTVLLQNVEHRRCIVQNARGFYDTVACDRYSLPQRWNIG
ncbi:RICIN domain-containing protein [Amycolatopsis sp. NPDC052450]|uniref:RICIN domain-containing protein n=1 Tax=Amycolatopsis sp. NPDC052450 TaxID=3363937 RepID=UPI0037C8ACED